MRLKRIKCHDLPTYVLPTSINSTSKVKHLSNKGNKRLQVSKKFRFFTLKESTARRNNWSPLSASGNNLLRQICHALLKSSMEKFFVEFSGSVYLLNLRLSLMTS